MERLAKYYLSLLVLFALNLGIWLQVVALSNNGVMKISFLDIGQGDSILITAPNGRTMLIDGGPGASVLGELGRSMGFFDRSIDVVLATHPDKDHVGGLPFVFDHYRVGHFVDSVADGETNIYAALEQAAKDERADIVYGMRGMTIVLDKRAGVYFHILFPGPDDFALTETNDLSIVGRLVYGDTSVMLTGDAPKMAEAALYSSDGAYLKSTILKAGHHGSRTSSSAAFVRAVDPSYAIISAGADNSYGHPHKEVMDLFAAEKIPVLETAKEGTIVFKSNGIDVWTK